MHLFNDACLFRDKDWGDDVDLDEEYEEWETALYRDGVTSFECPVTKAAFTVSPMQAGDWESNAGTVVVDSQNADLDWWTRDNSYDSSA